jgi:peptidoglycan/LPS O-acetylase OafA/YrhL
MLAFVVVRLSPAAVLAGLAALAGAFVWVYAEAFEYVLDRHGLARVALEFPIGCLLYRLSRKLAPGAAVVLLGASIASAVAAFGSRWGDLAVVPMLAALILVCASRNPVSRLLSARWLVWLGEISYAIYMTHLIVLSGASRVAGPVIALAPRFGRPAMMAASLAGLIVVAAILHYTVERPLRERFRRRLQPRAGEALGTAPLVLSGS